MVRHEAVRKKCEVFVDCRAPELHMYRVGALARDEERAPFICAESQEILINADVVEGLRCAGLPVIMPTRGQRTRRRCGGSG
jgi:hypothetical protein